MRRIIANSVGIYCAAVLLLSLIGHYARDWSTQHPATNADLLSIVGYSWGFVAAYAVRELIMVKPEPKGK